MAFFNEVKKKLGFGCMRLPMNGDDVNYEEFEKMIKYFMDNGFNYFDTAHPYIQQKSEIAVGDCLCSKYPRDSFVLANKLTSGYIDGEASLKPLFESQLKACKTDYFDFYLMHAVGKNNYKKYVDSNSYQFMKKLKSEGKVKHIGFSFHDTPEFLEEVIKQMPEMEFVQLQINYLDWENPNVESRRILEVANKYNLPVIIMEPVKGGALVNLTTKAQEEIDKLGNKYSNAGYAVRFASSQKNVFMTLSGMSNMEQMMDNCKTMKDFVPLNDEETKCLENVRNILVNEHLIACTKCKYCVDGCPKSINIPELFELYNSKMVWKSGWTERHYLELPYKANQCIKCGKCERICPQHLNIRSLLEEISSVYDK